MDGSHGEPGRLATSTSTSILLTSTEGRAYFLTEIPPRPAARPTSTAHRLFRELLTRRQSRRGPRSALGVPCYPIGRTAMAGNSTESGRSVTSKITSILMTFTQGSEHSLTEIARLAGLPISTAHRLTAELTSWRLLEHTPDGRYRAGLPLRMISDCPDRIPTLHERAPCVLEDLAATTRRRARLGVLQELQVAYIEKQPCGVPERGTRADQRRLVAVNGST
jgi:IclR helix-turn-helix domain